MLQKSWTSETGHRGVRKQNYDNYDNSYRHNLSASAHPHIFSYLLIFAFLKVTLRACVHLKDDKLVLLCIFFGEGQNRSSNKDSDYFLLPLVKRREYPGLSFSTDYANGLILNDEILRTSRDSLSVLNKDCGSLASEKAHNVPSHISPFTV